MESSESLAEADEYRSAVSFEAQSPHVRAPSKFFESFDRQDWLADDAVSCELLSLEFGS